jgi:hypothetical protein
MLKFPFHELHATIIVPVVAELVEHAIIAARKRPNAVVIAPHAIVVMMLGCSVPTGTGNGKRF